MILFISGINHSVQAKKLRVVATLSNYGDIARIIGGDHVDVFSIGNGDQDPHFIRPKPSYASLLQKADVFISTGLDLELWEPALLTKAGHARIMPGNPGYIGVSTGITLLEKPVTVSREMGDIHVYGNPHVYTSPWLMRTVAKNIAEGFKRVDPDNAETYDRNLQTFLDRIDRALFGDTLVNMFGSRLLEKLMNSGRFWYFMENKQYKGKPLKAYLGGWMKKMLPLRGKTIVCYHKIWIYFTTLFGIHILDYIEPKPGIPPGPGHVAQVIREMKEKHVHILLSASYFPASKVEQVAQKAGARPVIVSMGVTQQYPTYFDVVDQWVEKLTRAFHSASRER